MKQSVLLILFLSCGLFSQAQKVVTDTAKAPKFYFIGGDTHDFGTVKEGPDIEYTFVFRNVGKTPLIITQWSASGGNEIADWSRDPVLPGKTGRIKLGMHTTGRIGPFQKTFYIQSNALARDGRYQLYIKGIVVQEPAIAVPK